MNTSSQTASTKCQYQETTSTVVCLLAVIWPFSAKAEDDAHDDHADRHVQGMETDQSEITGVRTDCG